MKQVNINGIFFVTDSPSKYICRDHPAVSITYHERTVKVKTKSKVAGRKFKKVLMREWILHDGRIAETFTTLSCATTRLYDALKTVFSDII